MSCTIKKVFMAALVAALFVSVPCAQNADSADMGSSGDVEDETADFASIDNIDDLFSEESDLEEPVTTSESSDGSSTSISFLSIPLEMKGSLAAEVGAALLWEDHFPSGTAYFDLTNYLNFITRPDKYIALKGSLKTSIPDSTEADNDNQNQYFYLYELYFDYIMANRVYITAGKKKSTWGCIRLFCSDDSSDETRDDDALYTNPLYDSRYNISGIIKVPFGPSSITMLTMYRGYSDVGTTPSYRDLSFAGNAEFVFWGTYLGLFARSFPSSSGTLARYYRNPIIGAELKRSFFGFDVYGQGQCYIVSMERLRKFWEKDLYSSDSVSKLIFTGGFYKLWDSDYPYVGVNAEFQGIYYPNDFYDHSYSDDGEWIEGEMLHESGYFTKRVIVDFGLSKLGRDKNLKFGLQWSHDFTAVSGYLKPVVIVSRAFPHCDWRTGFKWEYDKSYDYGKFTFGSYLRFSLDY